MRSKSKQISDAKAAREDSWVVHRMDKVMDTTGHDRLSGHGWDHYNEGGQDVAFQG